MTPEAIVSAAAVRRLLRPRSVAIIGVSGSAGSMGGRSLLNLERFAFPGDIHLVSRSSEKVRGRPCLPSVDELPKGVDTAIIALPRQAVIPALEQCARRGVGSAVIYAAGFAEAGEEGLAQQTRITAIAREADMAVLGPNTLGMTNYVDSLCLAFGPNGPNPPAGRRALAVLAQSGAMMGSLRLSARVRDYAVSYAIATGNESVTSVEDFLAHIVDDTDTHAIAVFAEQLRRPAEFLALARRARENGKPVVLLHPGRSARARASATSHTGALSGDYEVMRTLVAREGVVVVETLEEWLDSAEFFTRFAPDRPSGPAVITDSGAVRGLALDLAESLGLPLPEPSPATAERLRQRLPAFAEAGNPLDITAQGLKDMPLYAEATAALANDPGNGGILVAVMPGSPEIGMAKAQAILPVLKRNGRPQAYVVLGDALVDPALPSRMAENGVPFFRSPERALRAFAHAARYAALGERARRPRPAPGAHLPRVEGRGTLPEHAGKALLRRIGLAVPDGGLATSPDHAAAIAAGVGYPVVLKIQSAQLPHKTEVGGIAVGLRDEAALRSTWSAMMERAGQAQPSAEIDGCLVEAVTDGGLEMVVGGRRDPDWGPVVLFGLGGVWIEALNDVRLLPADVEAGQVIEEMDLLQTQKLLNGYRGSAPIDKAAFAAVVVNIGQLLLAHPEITEIDINPLVVFPSGKAPVALDALIILKP